MNRYHPVTFKTILYSLVTTAIFLVAPLTLFAQSGSGYSVSISESNVAVYDDVTISWTVPPGASSKDWVGLFRIGAPDDDYIRWTYLTNGNTNRISYPVREAGTYEARIFLNDSYEQVAVSNSVSVGADNFDDDADSDFNDGPGSNNNDRTNDFNNDNDVDDDFNNDDDFDDGPGSGPGGSGQLSVPNRVTEGESFTVSYSGNVGNRDWIGIYRTGDSDRSYEAWKYVDDDGDARFEVDEPGTYEARYFLDRGYERVVVSDRFEVVRENNNTNGNNGNPPPAANNGNYGGGWNNANEYIEVDDDEYETGDRVEVSWDLNPPGNNRRSWIGLYRTDSNNREYIAWKYTGGNRTGTMSFTINDPGEYEFRYFRNSGYGLYATSDSFWVRDEQDNGNGGGPGGSGQLSVPNRVTEGESFTVSYSGNVGNRDWIGIYRTGDSDRSYEAWKYVDDDGDARFEVDEPGTYEARYFKNNGYTRVAVSERFTVVSEDDDDDDDDGPGGGPGNGSVQLTVPDQVTEGESFSVSYSGSNSTRDWIGIYRVGDSDRSYEEWEYARSTNGSVRFRIDDPGTYEARFFRSNSYDRVAVSERFTVVSEDDDDDDDDGPGGGPGGNDDYELGISDDRYEVGDTLVVSWEADAADDLSRDWIGLYKTGSGDRGYVDWEYIDDDRDSGSVRFFLKDPGEYELRYFKNNGYTRVAVSEKFIVEDEDGNGGGHDDDDDSDADYELSISDTAIETGETITVSWESPSWLNLRRDWVGLYRTGADDEDYIYWGYIDRFGASGSLTFRVNSPGTYEFRYLKNSSYDVVAVSDTFTVSDDGMSSVCPLTSSELAMIENYPPPSGPIIALGDSLTEGVGASSGWDYVSQLERQSGVDIINAGVSGDTTRDILDRLDSDVLDRDPSVVIVWAGGNDIIGRVYEDAEDGLDDLDLDDRLELLALRIKGRIPDSQGISQAETFDNLETIVERIQASGAATIVVGFGDGFYEDGLEDGYREVAENTNSIYVEGILDGILGRPSLMDDLVHPDEDGYEIVANRIQPNLQCML